MTFSWQPQQIPPRLLPATNNGFFDPEFSKQDKRSISPPWYFVNLNGAGIPGVVESESGSRFVRVSMGEATSNFESAQLWQHVHLVEGATLKTDGTGCGDCRKTPSAPCDPKSL